MKPAYFIVFFNGVDGGISSLYNAEYSYNCFDLESLEWSKTTHEVKGVPCAFARKGSKHIIVKVGSNLCPLADGSAVKNGEQIALTAARYFPLHLPLIVPPGTERLGEMIHGALEGPIVARGQSGRTSQYLVETPWGLVLQELTQDAQVCLNTSS